MKRAKGLASNHAKAKPIFPLLMYGMDKKACIDYVQAAGIEIPLMYQLGFQNNNCFKTGCVQGAIGYWQKIKREFPKKWEAMADMEQELTEAKGEPVFICKDQSGEAQKNNNQTVFLRTNPNYPEIKTIDDMTGREPEPLVECNGFCGTNDLLEQPVTPDNLEFDF